MTQPPTAKVGVARGRCDDLDYKQSHRPKKVPNRSGGEKPAGRFIFQKSTNIIYNKEIKLTTKSADLAQIFPS